MQKIFNKNFFIYFFTAVLTIAIVIWIMQLWNADINIPFLYSGDGLCTNMFIKGIIDNGWWLHNSFIGMPTGNLMFDFPNTDNFSFLLIKLISIFCNNYAAVMNCFYLLTFPMIALSSLFVMHQLKISYMIAIIISLIYSFLPYHFMRGEGHLFLSVYFMIPFMVMIIIWVYSEDLIFPLQLDNTGINNKLVYKYDKKILIGIVICLIISSTGIYYAFFASFFLLLAGISGGINSKKIRKFWVSLFFIGTILLGIIINISPTLIYHYQHGNNTLTAKRSPIESEIYGLKITQLLMPADGHRISWIAQEKAKYNKLAPLVNENTTASLGLIGSIGFLILLFALFKRHSEPKLYCLSLLNISAVLLATIGGFGAIFAFIVSPEIRAYNRISIYIAYFSLLAIALLLDKFTQKFVQSPNVKVLMMGGLVLILIFGILDQTNSSDIPNYYQNKLEFSNDTEFISRIEHQLPQNSMIFQFPYVPFPENPPVNNMGDYELFRGYLHSNSLRWSYGAMKGREGDLWQQEVTSKPVPELVQTLSLAGFNGIYIDRWGYADNAVTLESDFSKLLSIKPMVSNNGRLSFFDLTNYTQKLKRHYTQEQWTIKSENVLHPVLLSWQDGFSTIEGTLGNNWRWCSEKGQLRIMNASSKENHIKIKMMFATGYQEKSTLTINSDLFNDKLSINNNGTEYARELIVPPGNHIISFKSDAKRVYAPDDPRNLIFRIINFKMD